MKKLEREQQRLLNDLRAMLRKHIRTAVDNDDVKQTFDLIKLALVAKDWQWIFDENINPWIDEPAGSGKKIEVRIYGENDLV